MNVFELSCVAAPIVGAVAGTIAAQGHGIAVVAACCAGGAIIGLACHFGPALVASKLIRRETLTGTKVGEGDSPKALLGLILCLLVAASPIATWFATTSIVSWVLGGPS